MTRILHIFSPSFGYTFSGHNKRWVRQFQSWDDCRFVHQILLPFERRIIKADSVGDAFRYFGPKVSFNTSVWGKAWWCLSTLISLVFLRSRYDVLHIHTQQWGSLLVAPLTAILRRPSLREIVRIGSDDPSTLLKAPNGKLRLWCFNQFSRVMCISEALKDDCLQHGVEGTKVQVIMNPVDSALFSPEHMLKEKLRTKLRLPKDATIILYVGSVIHRKGIDVLVEAFTSLAQIFPDLILLLVGPNTYDASIGVNEAFVKNIKSNIIDNGLNERVIFAGRVDDDELLAEYYRSADVFVFPTRQEGLGNVLLEAMASGLPCVASHLNQITDLIIQDGENGILVPPEDIKFLTDKIKCLIENEGVRQQLGCIARKSVIENHSFKKYQMDLIELYKSMFDDPA